MNKDWLIGFLGAWLVVLSFLGFPSSVQRVLVIISGLVIALVSFWRGVNKMIAESIEKPKQ